MVPSKKLFDLVKSLTQSEKMYVKKRASTFRKNSRNIVLFELINKQVEYNEEELRDLFVKSRDNTFAFTKNYLYNFILESLELFHRVHPRREIRVLMNQVEILSKKGLHDQVEDLLRRIKSMANKFQMKKVMLEVIEWEVLIQMNRRQTKETPKVLNKLFDEFTETIDEVREEMEVMKAFNLLRNRHLLIGMPRKKSETRLLSNLIQSVSMERKAYQKQFKKYYYSLSSLAVYYFTINDFSSAYKYIKQVETLFNANSDWQKQEGDLYLSFILRKGLFEERLGMKDEIFVTLNAGRAYMNRYEVTDHRLMVRFYIFCLGMFNTYKRFREGMQVIDKLLLIKRSSPGSIFGEAEEQLAIVTISDTYFETEDFRRANFYLNQIFDRKLKYRMDIYCFAYVKSILIHFELGNFDILPYRIKTTLSYLKRQNKLYQTEVLVLNFIREWAHKSCFPSRNDYVSLRIELLRVLDGAFERNVLNYYDFLGWVNRKVQ